uniref:Alpha-soluble NSF attachment protein n=1 Tax=Schistosoma japonicum TaxID=6182 RepID=C1L5L8_SCHJA|nr:Alpha-soluble NSF attachment protein [Schistosoma japonicum]
MDENEKKARELIAQAQNKNKKGLFSFVSGSDKTDEVISLYEKAGNCFKMAHNWTEAGNAFLKAASLSLNQGSKHDAATRYVDASVAFKKEDPAKAIECLTEAIKIYTDMGRFTIAAKHHLTVAQIYEENLVDIEQAIRHYEQAADYYKGEDSSSSAMKCQLSVAKLSARLGQYVKAANLFEEVGKASSGNSLLKFSTKGHLFNAVICHFCVDLINGQKALKTYEEYYPDFAGSRECGLMKKLSEALEHENVEAFTMAVKEYDSITRLDPLITSLMLKLKKTISDEEDIT